MRYKEVKALQNNIIKDFIDDNNLFAIFKLPVNILFADNFVANIKNMKDIFKQNCLRENIFFSCKCNKSFAFLKVAADCGCGIEASSKFELRDALKYTKKIIATGPGKDDEYLKLSIENEVIISVDDIEELKSIVKFDKRVSVLLRCSSNWIGIPSRFGIQKNGIDDCLELIKDNHIDLLGFSFHINNYNLNDRIRIVKEILDLVKNKKLSIKVIDIGGGIPVNYCSKEQFEDFILNNKKEFYFANKNIKSFYPYFNKVAENEFLNKILQEIRKDLGDIEIYAEPGRVLVNNCGISVYKVEYVKETQDGNIVVVNSNINNLSEQWFNTDYLIEPKLYLKNQTNSRVYFASVAGNLCLENDMVTWRKIKFLHKPKSGDLLIYYNTAGYQMDSNESMFHKITFVEKYVVHKQDDIYVIRKDKEYDRE